MTIEFKDPPTPHGPNPAHFDEVVAKLKARPGVWALVAEDVNVNHREGYHRRGCETTSRSSRTNGYKPGRVDIYARWPATP